MTLAIVITLVNPIYHWFTSRITTGIIKVHTLIIKYFYCRLLRNIT